MKKIIVGVSLLILASALAPVPTNGQSPAKDAKIEQEVRAANQELKEASRRKDRAAFERLIADDFTFIHSNGATDTKKTYIDKATAGAFSIQQAGAGVEVQDEQLRLYEGSTAVWITRGTLVNKSQNTEMSLRSVAVYVRIDGRWQWVFGQSSPLPARPKAAAIDHRLYDTYTGEYEIGAGRTFTVIKEGDTLRGLTTNRQPGELIPKSDTEFIWFNPNVNLDAQVIFIKGESGQVTHVAFRANGQEVWRAKKVK